MAKLQVRLLVLIALGTISMGQDATGPPPDSVAVITSPTGTPPLSCGPPKTVNVRFNEVKVKGPDSDVVYHRVTVRDEHLQFATNNSVSLPSDSLPKCAKAAAGTGLDAFVFNGSCTGYSLIFHFLKCQTGDVVVYVLPDYLDTEPAVVPIDEAPYKVIDDGEVEPYKVYMLSAYVEVADDHPSIKKVEELTVPGYEQNYIFRENGDITQSFLFLLDINSCMTNGAHGLQVVLSPVFSLSTHHVKYFFEECGKTVKFLKETPPSNLLVFSHPGLGCKDYPSGLPDECKVIFKSENSEVFNSVFGFYFFETDPEDSGLIMHVTGKTSVPQNDKTLPMYSDNSDTVMGEQLAFEVTLESQPTKRAIGFFLVFVFPDGSQGK